MLTNYKEKCEILVKNHIEQNTRYKLDNFTLEDYQEFIANFQVEVVNELVVSYNKEIIAGSINVGDRQVFFKQEEFMDALQYMIDKQIDNEANFKYLIDEISSGKYGKFKEEQTILEDKKSILYEHYCRKCGGEGHKKCDKYDCIKGQIECKNRDCKNGRVKKTRIVNGKKKEYYEDCSQCRGKGSISCPRCKGSATLRCETCSGKGIATTIARVCVNVEPSYKIIYPENINQKIKNAIKRYEITELNSIARLKRETIQHDTTQKIVTEIYNAEIPFASFNVIYNDKKFTWLVCGTNLQVLDDGKMLKHLLSSDADTLFELAKKISWHDAQILQESQSAVANFMNSELNQKIMQTDQDINYFGSIAMEERIEKLERWFKDDMKSLQFDYIQNTLKSFDKMVKSFCAGITLEYFKKAFIVSFIIALIIPYGFLASIAIFPFFIHLSNKRKKPAFKKWWNNDILISWIEKNQPVETKYTKSTIISIIIISVVGYFVNLGVLIKQFTSPQTTIQTQIQSKPQQEVVKVQEQTQVVEKPAKTQTAEPQTATPTQTQTQIQSESVASVDYEQKFGKRIYLTTKDEFVNMRNAPSGEIVAKIYKKDFADIMLYSFDTNSNEKWLKVVYFPPNVKDEQSAISGYIHISQIDKNKLN